MLSQGQMGALLYRRPSWSHIWEFKVTCGVKLMSLRHGWGWYPPQNASHIHIRHIQSVLAISMLSQGHMGVPPYRYTGQVGPLDLGIQGHWSSENDAIASWLRLMSTSDHFTNPYQIYTKCLSHWYAVSRAFWCTCMRWHWPSWLQIWEFMFTENDVIRSCLRLISTSDHFIHPLDTYKVFEPLTCCLRNVNTGCGVSTT